MRLVGQWGWATAVTAVATAGVWWAPSAGAAGCSGTLRVTSTRIAVAQVRPSPPPGYAYATQPSVDPVAGEGVPVSVSVTRDGGCSVAGANVSLEASETGPSGFTVRRTGTTNAQGNVVFTVKPVRATDLRSSARVADETAASDLLPVRVRSALSGAWASPGGCAVTATGSVYPRTAGKAVWLQRRIVHDGAETGFVTLTRGRTGSDGTYRLTYRAPCSADYTLATYAPPETGNTGGRSRYVDLHVIAAR